MPKSLVSLGLSIIFLLGAVNSTFGQTIRLSETIKVDATANFQVTPRSFCVTEDEIFLFPDYEGSTIKIFSKKENSLKLINELGPKFEEKIAFSRPMYCFYSLKEGKLGVIDYGSREIFIFGRRVKDYFELIKIVDCPRLGYDMEFAGDGDQLIVSGYTVDKANNPFDLYGINIISGQINYLLPSYEKYNLKTTKDWILEYRQKQTLPAIGIKAFIDIQGDYLFFIWEGSLKVIKFNLDLNRIQSTFGHETLHYNRPLGAKLSDSFKKGDSKTWKKLKREGPYSYIRNTFATSKHVFLIYETSGNIFRLQTYTPEGDYISDILIPHNPGRQMWMDKEDYELYAFAGQEGSNTILKYKIIINR